MTPIEIAREAMEDIESNGWTFQIFARTKASEALTALVKVEAEISELRQSLAAAPAAQQPTVPEGYALVGIDALKAWGVYDQVREACQYPAQQPDRITPAELAKRIEQGEQWEVAQQPCPLCNYQHGHAIGCENNPVDIALEAKAGQQPQAEAVHPAVKPDTLVNRGALQMALNVLRRAGKTEVADELEKTIQPQAEAVLRKLEWVEVRHEYRDSEYFCPICDGDKKQGHEAGCELAAALTPQQAEAVPPGYALVPKRMTKAMEYVTEQEDWTWEDLLAAVEVEYSEIAQADAPVDHIPQAFNAWWDVFYDDSNNPFSKGSAAYWAWAGWQAALEQPQANSNKWIRGDWVWDKQPQAEAVPSDVTDAMALAFHRALTDGDIGQHEVEDIKIGLRAALAAQGASQIPE